MQHETIMINNVRTLRIQEPPTIKVDTINGLKHALGLQPSREVVERAAYEVSERLNRLEMALFEGDLTHTAKLASGLIGISRQIGLKNFANVAGHLVNAIENNDFVAIAAISRRLLRLGEAALFQAVGAAEDPICS